MFLLQREGFSRFNKIYEYDYRLLNQNCAMVMTSVSGHLLGLEFVGQYRKWLVHLFTVKNAKNLDTRKFFCNHYKYEQGSPAIE